MRTRITAVTAAATLALGAAAAVIAAEPDTVALFDKRYPQCITYPCLREVPAKGRTLPDRPAPAPRRVA